MASVKLRNPGARLSDAIHNPGYVAEVLLKIAKLLRTVRNP